MVCDILTQKLTLYQYCFQATIGGRYASLTMLVDDDAEIDSIVTGFKKEVTDTATELLGKQRRKKTPWLTDEIPDCSDRKRDLMKKRGDL